MKASRIFGIPDSYYDYEFMVVIPREDGNFDWHSNHETAKAYDVALKVGGIVCHNVRIQRKKLSCDHDCKCCDNYDCPLIENEDA